MNVWMYECMNGLQLCAKWPGYGKRSSMNSWNCKEQKSKRAYELEKCVVRAGWRGAPAEPMDVEREVEGVNVSEVRAGGAGGGCCASREKSWSIRCESCCTESSRALLFGLLGERSPSIERALDAPAAPAAPISSGSACRRCITCFRVHILSIFESHTIHFSSYFSSLIPSIYLVISNYERSRYQAFLEQRLRSRAPRGSLK